MKAYVKEIDIFSSGFQFMIGGNFKKKTTFGGVLSFMLVIILIVYFIYLMYRYFSSQFIPKINMTSQNLIERVEYEIDEDFFLFEFIVGYKVLADYEAQIGKKYIQYKVQSQYYDEDGEGHYIDMNIKKCDNPLFVGLKCIDLSNSKEGSTIMTDNTLLIQSNISIEVIRCHDDPDCAPIDEIDDFILQQIIYFQTYTKSKYFNTTTEQLEVSYMAQYFFFDIDLIEQMTFTVKKQITEIKKGLIIQHSQFVEHLIGFDLTNVYYVQKNIKQRQDIESYGQIILEISQEVVKAQIQFPSFVEIMTQFLTLVNLLLGLGFVARYFAQNNILKDVAEIILKIYYRNSAIDLIKKHQNNEQKFSDDLNQKEFDQLKKLDASVEEYNFTSKISSYIGLGLINKFRMIFQNEFIRKDSQKDSFTYEYILNEAMHQIDFYDYISDLLKIKKSINLYLSPQQYAALDYCCSNIFDGQDPNQLQNIAKKEPQLVNQELNDIESNPQPQFQKIKIAPIITENEQLTSKYQNSINFNIEMAEGDNKRTLNLEGDDQVLGMKEEQQQQDSIQIPSYINILNRNQEKKCNSKENHLIKLDQIDKNSDQKNFYFERFLEKYQKKNNPLSQLDKRLYQSIYKQKQS